MADTRLRQCGLYAAHRCAVIEEHHVCPLSWWLAAGKSVATPMAALCPNCHMNVHAAIDAILAGDVFVLPPRAVRLARQAFAIAASAGLTPARTL